VAYDGTNIYVTNYGSGSNSVSVIDPATNNVTDTIDRRTNLPDRGGLRRHQHLRHQRRRHRDQNRAVLITGNLAGKQHDTNKASKQRVNKTALTVW